MVRSLDWGDLRFFVAVAEKGSLSAAAKILRVDAGTVSRRIAAMEAVLGHRFFERRPDGYPLTDQGRILLQHARRVEEEIVSLNRSLDAASDRIEGLVTVTASEPLASAFILPSLPRLYEMHPRLKLDFFTDNRLLSLTKREVDVAVRMNRPDENKLLAKRIGNIPFGLYASSTYLSKHGVPKTLDELSGHHLIDWLEDFPQGGPLIWFRQITQRTPARLRVNSSRERASAAELHLGIAALPHLAARATKLKRILDDVEVPLLEVWLITHPESAKIRRVRTVMQFLSKQAGILRSDD